MSKDKVLVLKNQAVVNYDNLDAIIDEIMGGLDNYNFDLDMVYTQDDIKVLKTLLADYRKKVKAVNDERISFKNQYMQPYDEVHNKIKLELTDPANDKFAKATKIINTFENNLKKAKEDEVREYFIQENQQELISFEQLQLKVNLTTTVASLKKEVDEKLSRINTDIALIDTQEYKDRILVEYFKTLDAPSAIMYVNNAIKQEQALAELTSQAETKVVPTKATEQAKQVKQAKLNRYVFRLECNTNDLVEVRNFLQSKGIAFDYKEVLS